MFRGFQQGMLTFIISMKNLLILKVNLLKPGQSWASLNIEISSKILCDTYNSFSKNQKELKISSIFVDFVEESDV